MKREEKRRGEERRGEERSEIGSGCCVWLRACCAAWAVNAAGADRLLFGRGGRCGRSWWRVCAVNSRQLIGRFAAHQHVSDGCISSVSGRRVSDALKTPLSAASGLLGKILTHTVRE